MIKLIELSLRFRVLVIVIALIGAIWGFRAMQTLPLDALPDLSDVQVIVKTPYPGQAPELVEQQVTYPLSTVMLSVPGANVVRGFSFFGDSYLYIIFDEGTDPYWARSRVLEYLQQANSILPDGVTPTLGPDASGVGWIYQYALTASGSDYHLADLKSLQDWYLKLGLQSVPGVSEVATVGGMERTYQIIVEPARLLYYGLTIEQVKMAIQAANLDTGGSVLELAEAEYMIRSQGYLQSISDIEETALPIQSEQFSSLRIKHIATVREGPQMRRGIAELNGEGEVVGGIVVMRQGENALATIDKVEQRLQELKAGLPEGVELVTTYDRSSLIERSVANLQEKLFEEILIVILVCFAFLLHVRSTLVAVICLPLSVLLGFIVMNALQINVNIMSLGGIAIAIGALVDAAIVMVENQHKHLQAYHQTHQAYPQGKQHWLLTMQAAKEVGPALGLTLLLITISFLPVFALQAQEGRLFTPLAMTKTLVMAGAALLSVTLVPVLMGYFIRGKVPDENRNWLNRGVSALYRPILNLSLNFPKLTVLAAVLVALSTIYPISQMQSEFMPQLEEGDLLYMPTTLPAVSISEAGEILQQTDRLIRTVPEVASVFGKVGRAETATDSAPLTMLETTIALKPKAQWRAGTELSDIIAELEAKVQFPGVSNAWVQPIKTRIDMLTTGVKTPLGIKISGPEIHQLENLGQDIEGLLAKIPQTLSVYAERAESGRYINIQPDRLAAATYGLTIEDIQQVVTYAIGGANVSDMVLGRERYPINLRYPDRYRQSVDDLNNIPFVSPTGARLTLGQVASVNIAKGPALVKSENGRPIAWVFIDIEPGTSIAEYIDLAGPQLAKLNLPATYTWSFAGEYEYIKRVNSDLTWLIPLTILLIFILLYLIFSSIRQSLLVLFTLPIALSGSIWLVYFLDYAFSIAMAVGMIALAGVAAEFGVIMLIYLNQQFNRMPVATHGCAKSAVRAGAMLRVRPKAMTVLTIIAGLLPIMLGSGSGNEMMQRIAAPMVGGMLLSPLVSMFVIPCCYLLLYRHRFAKQENQPASAAIEQVP